LSVVRGFLSGVNCFFNVLSAVRAFQDRKRAFEKRKKPCRALLKAGKRSPKGYLSALKTQKETAKGDSRRRGSVKQPSTPFDTIVQTVAP
jgi:hypothetical protein